MSDSQDAKVAYFTGPVLNIRYRGEDICMDIRELIIIDLARRHGVGALLICRGIPPYTVTREMAEIIKEEWKNFYEVANDTNRKPRVN